MLQCTGYETRMIIEGRANGIIVRYDKSTGCPHKVKDKMYFTNSDISKDGKQIPFAIGTIVSIRPGTVRELASDEELVRMNGFANANVFKDHLRRKYSGIPDTAMIWNIRFRLDSVDKITSKR